MVKFGKNQRYLSKIYFTLRKRWGDGRLGGFGIFPCTKNACLLNYFMIVGWTFHARIVKHHPRSRPGTFEVR